jgi:hypothetical protein
MQAQADSQNRPFQIHLSTALILSLEAGVIMWANFTARATKIWSGNPRMPDDTVLRVEYGWPVKVSESATYTPCGPPNAGEYVYGRVEAWVPTQRRNGALEVIVDLAVALFILRFTFCYCERNAQGPAKPPQSRAPWLRLHLLTAAIIGIIIVVPFLGSNDERYLNVFAAELSLVIVALVFELTLYCKITGPKLFTSLLFSNQ